MKNIKGLVTYLFSSGLDIKDRFDLLKNSPYTKYIFILLIALIFSLYKLGLKPLLTPNKTSYAASNTAEISKPVEAEKPSFIFVDISGAVTNPGVYTLSANSRVGDLIKASGGFTQNTSSLWVAKILNLAKKLKDGDKIYIPFVGDVEYISEINKSTDELLSQLESPDQDTQNSINTSDTNYENGAKLSITLVPQKNITPTKTNSSTGPQVTTKINVNSANLAQLDSLNGVGPAYANKIIANRPYKDLNEFYSKSGLSRSLVDKLAAYIAF